MALLTVADIAIAGVTKALVAADVAGDTFANTANEFIEVFNNSGGNCTVTPTITGSVSTGETLAPTLVVIANGASALIGPFNTTMYGTVVDIQYSTVTSVTVQVFKLPSAQASNVIGA